MGRFDVRRGYTCPRWLYVPGFVVPHQNTQQVSPSDFENVTPWRWRLVNLTFTSPIQEDAPQGRTFDWWSRDLLIEVGKTGCSDQDLVMTPINEFCATPLHLRQKAGGVCLGVDFRLPTPYRLARDSGFEVKVENLDQTRPILHPPTIIFRGRTEAGQPIILGGRGGDLGLDPQSGEVIVSADLFNKGRQECYIDRIILKDIDTYQGEGAATTSFKGSWIGWQINPTHGTQWMPVDQRIPVGNLAPMAWRQVNPLTFMNTVPRVHHFAPHTYLYPKQRLGVRFTNQATYDIGVNPCLQVEMEVM